MLSGARAYCVQRIFPRRRQPRPWRLRRQPRTGQPRRCASCTARHRPAAARSVHLVTEPSRARPASGSVSLRSMLAAVQRRAEMGQGHWATAPCCRTRRHHVTSVSHSKLAYPHQALPRPARLTPSRRWGHQALAMGCRRQPVVCSGEHPKQEHSCCMMMKGRPDPRTGVWCVAVQQQGPASARPRHHMVAGPWHPSTASWPGCSCSSRTLQRTRHHRSSPPSHRRGRRQPCKLVQRRRTCMHLRVVHLQLARCSQAGATTGRRCATPLSGAVSMHLRSACTCTRPYRSLPPAE